MSNPQSRKSSSVKPERVALNFPRWVKEWAVEQSMKDGFVTLNSFILHCVMRYKTQTESFPKGQNPLPHLMSYTLQPVIADADQQQNSIPAARKVIRSARPKKPSGQE